MTRQPGCPARNDSDERIYWDEVAQPATSNVAAKTRLCGI